MYFLFFLMVINVLLSFRILLNVILLLKPTVQEFFKSRFFPPGEIRNESRVNIKDYLGIYMLQVTGHPFGVLDGCEPYARCRMPGLIRRSFSESYCGECRISYSLRYIVMVEGLAVIGPEYELSITGFHFLP